MRMIAGIKLFDYNEVAELCKVEVRTVRKWKTDKKIKTCVIGGIPYISLQNLQTFLNGGVAVPYPVDYNYKTNKPGFESHPKKPEKPVLEQVYKEKKSPEENQETIDLDKLYSPNEAAAILGMKKNTFRTYVTRGNIKKTKFGTGRGFNKFKGSDLVEYMNS